MADQSVNLAKNFINGDAKHWAVFSIQLFLIVALIWYSVSNLKDFPARLIAVENRLTTHEAVQDIQNKDLNDRLDRIESKLDNVLQKKGR